jgi:hypothetical protein
MNTGFIEVPLLVGCANGEGRVPALYDKVEEVAERIVDVTRGEANDGQIQCRRGVVRASEKPVLGQDGALLRGTEKSPHLDMLNGSS